MKVNPDDPRTTSEQVASEIRRLIKSQELREGDRLPSVRSLMADLGVSSQTVQTSLSALKIQGLIDTVPGRGAFVKVGIDIEGLVAEPPVKSTEPQTAIKHQIGEVLDKLDSLEALVLNVEGRVRDLEDGPGADADQVSR